MDRVEVNQPNQFHPLKGTTSHDNDFTCAISQPIGDFAHTITTSEVRVATGGGELGTISLDGVAVNTQTPIELTMTCEGAQAPYAAQVLDPRIVAVKLGKAVHQ